MANKNSNNRRIGAKLNKKGAKMPKLTELEQKRQKAQKVLPELRKLLDKYGFENVNYVWQKVIKAERELSVAKAKAEKAAREAEKIEKRLLEEL